MGEVNLVKQALFDNGREPVSAAPLIQEMLRLYPENTIDPSRSGPAGLFKQDVAFRDRTGPRKRNLLRASRLGRIDKVRPIRQNMPIW